MNAVSTGGHQMSFIYNRKKTKNLFLWVTGPQVLSLKIEDRVDAKYVPFY